MKIGNNVVKGLPIILELDNIERTHVKWNVYNGPQYSGQELSKKYRLTDPCKWSIEHVNQKDSAHCEIQVSNCR